MMEKLSPFRAMIASEMRNQNISQAEMARRVGIAPQSFNAFMQSRRAIPFKTLEKICVELKIL